MAEAIISLLVFVVLVIGLMGGFPTEDGGQEAKKRHQYRVPPRDADDRCDKLNTNEESFLHLICLSESSRHTEIWRADQLCCAPGQRYRQDLDQRILSPNRQSGCKTCPPKLRNLHRQQLIIVGTKVRQRKYVRFQYVNGIVGLLDQRDNDISAKTKIRRLQILSGPRDGHGYEVKSQGTTNNDQKL